jgi:four helix bundle protein
MVKKKRDIYDRVYKFVLEVLEAVKIIPKTPENLVLIKQVVKSSTSIGANVIEADGAETKKEFIYKYSISKREAKETHYWLSLISDHNPKLKERFKPLVVECGEIIAIVSTIIINAKKK